MPVHSKVILEWAIDLVFMSQSKLHKLNNKHFCRSVCTSCMSAAGFIPVLCCFVYCKEPASWQIIMDECLGITMNKEEYEYLSLL